MTDTEIKVCGLHKAHPEWTDATIGFHCGLTVKQVKEILKPRKKKGRHRRVNKR